MLFFPRSARLAALLLLAAAALPAHELAASRGAAAAGPVTFECRDGVRFLVAFSGDSARITTAAGSWRLPRRPSSIGRKFQSGAATFIHDSGMAALNGLPGGPFRGCREAGRLLVRAQQPEARR